MDHIKITFVIGQVTEEELLALKNDEVIVSKMILVPEDYQLFHYKEGDRIQIETQHGNRLWCTIEHLEILERPPHVIIIFTLRQSEEKLMQK